MPELHEGTGVSVGGEKQRLFVAVPVPQAALLHVRRASEAVAGMAGVRILSDSQLHVTLAFIGEVDAERAGKARAVVEAVPATLGGQAELGRFLMLPSATRARVVTLEIVDREGVFARLFETVMRGLEAAGVMRREKRPFRPHLTIARLRAPAAVRPRFENEPIPFAVQSVCLFESKLRREGAEYTVVASKELTTTPAAAAE